MLRLVLGLIAWIAGVALGLRYGFESPWIAVLAIVLGAAGAWAAPSLSKPRVALCLGLAGLVATTMLVMGMHEELRGERRDEGPDPLQASLPLGVARAEQSWFLGMDGSTAVFRATGPHPRVVPKDPASPPTSRIENVSASSRPAAEGCRPQRILVWGDCRGGITVFDRLLDAIRERKPDFTIGLGDMVGMARTYQFEILRDRLAATGVAAFLVPGNHDLDPFETLRPYARVLGPVNWWFVSCGTLFLALDSANGHLDPASVATAERVARAAPPEVVRTVVLLHHPLWLPAGHDEKPLPANEEPVKRLKALCEERKAHVFCSHWHGYDVHQEGSVTQVTTGGAGSRLEYEGTHHYVWLEIDDAGVRFTKVDLSEVGEKFDRADRWKTFQLEGAYVARAQPFRVTLCLVLLTFGLGSLVAVFVRPSRPAPTTP